MSVVHRDHLFVSKTMCYYWELYRGNTFTNVKTRTVIDLKHLTLQTFAFRVLCQLHLCYYLMTLRMDRQQTNQLTSVTLAPAVHTT